MKFGGLLKAYGAYPLSQSHYWPLETLSFLPFLELASYLKRKPFQISAGLRGRIQLPKKEFQSTTNTNI